MKTKLNKKLSTLVALIIITFLFSFINVAYAEGEENTTTLLFEFRIHNNDQQNENNEEPDESINQERTKITFKKHVGRDREEHELYEDVMVSLIKGEEVEMEGQRVIRENEVCVLENQNDQHQGEIDLNPNDHVFKYDFNKNEYDGYYVKVESSINDNISIRYNYGSEQDSHSAHFNLTEGINAEQGNAIYIPVNQIMQNGYSTININGIDNKYENLKAIFSGYSEINEDKNKLTYKYNNNGNEENVYVELIKNEDWVWNSELNEGHGAPERIENVPMTLKEENGKYCLDFISQDKFNSYYLRLSFIENSTLEGQVCLTINGKRKEYNSYRDDKNQEIIEPRKISLWDYNNTNTIEISKVCSMFGEIPVEFKEINVQGKKITPSKNWYNQETQEEEEDENSSVRYNLENNISYEVNICERPDNNEQKSWNSTRFKLSEGLKLFSDKIQNGDYRISFGGNNDEAYLIVNDKIVTSNEMEEVKTYYWEENKDNEGNPILDEFGNQTWKEIESDRTERIYVLKPEDVINGKISIKIELNYVARMGNGIEVLNNGKTAKFRVGREENFVKATFNSKENIIAKEEDNNGHKEEFYEINFDEDEITDKLISLDNNFNSNTMEVAISGFGENYALPVYEENGQKYVKLTNLTRTREENGNQIQEPYYISPRFHLEIRMKGEGQYQDIPQPDLEKDYFTISAIVDEGAEGTVNYYFLKKVGNEYVYLDNEGNVLDGIEAAGTITEFPDGKAKIKYAPGTEYVEIRVQGNNKFTEPTNIRLFVDDEYIERLNVLDDNSNDTGEEIDFQDLVKHRNGRIAVNISELKKGMGMTLHFAYEQGNVDINDAGIYLNPKFSEEDTSATLNYFARENENVIDDATIDYNTRAEDKVVRLNQGLTELKLECIYSELINGIPQIHADIYDENKKLLEHEAGDIAVLLRYDGTREDGSPNSYWEDFMDNVKNGTIATLNLEPLKAVEHNYTIVLNIQFPSFEDPEEAQKPHVLTWSNDKSGTWGRDALIDGGKAYICEAYKQEENGEWTQIYDRARNGNKFNYGEPLQFQKTWNRNNGNMYLFAVDQDNKGGEVEAVEGIKVVYEFKPNYGKQLVDVMLGNGEFELGKNPRYYEFIMPLGHVHFSATFKNVENTTSGDYKNNTTYKVPNNIANIVSSGTLELSLKDVTNNLNAEQKKGFANVEGTNYNVTKYLDVDLNNIWYKGEDNANDTWKEPIYNLGDGNEVEITVKVPAGMNVKDVVILHEEHDGNKVTGYKKIIPISYNEANNTVTFKTSKFSKFAFATKAHQHTYKTVVEKKATLKANGTIVTKCECGNISKKTTIYYPKTISLSKTDFTYNKKAQKPTVIVKDSKGKKLKNGTDYTVKYSNSSSKKIGEYTVTITFKGNYEGKKVLKYRINPQGTSLSKVSANKKGFKAIWKAQKTETSGYEVQYATNSKFSSNKKTVTIKNNSTNLCSVSKLQAKKTYYVRVRTYKKINGKTYYSVWSAYKKVTTKK